MIELRSMIKVILIVILLIYIISTLFVSNIISDKIPKKITDRLSELNIKLLDGKNTLRDLAFHRFFLPNYLGELKKINAGRKDVVLNECLAKRRGLLIYLAISSIIVAAAVVFFFSIKIR